MQELNYKRDVTVIDFGLSTEQEQRAGELHDSLIVFDSLM